MTASPKALQSQAQALIEIVERLRRVVSDGQPADVELGSILRAHREYGSRDRRLFSEAAYSFFRWKGWTEHCSDKLDEQIALAMMLDAATPHPALPDVALLLEKTAKLSVAQLVPDWLQREVDADSFEPLVRSLQKRPPVWLRAMRGHGDRVLKALIDSGIQPQSHALTPNAICFNGSAQLDPIRRKIGAVFEVQDLASQDVAIACNPKPGERWWDICAGAGGKSLHLADLMNNRGEIVATDIRETALAELRRRAKLAGVTMIHSSKSPLVQPSFDGILIDAPCSGVGTWSRNPDARWRTEPNVPGAKAMIQLGLLEKTADRVKPGGSLVYSVCTVTRRETTDVVSDFLDRHPEYLATATRQIWPREGPCDGMFIAVMKRNG